MHTSSNRFVFISIASLITAILLLVLPTPRVTSAVGTGVDVHVDTTTDEYNGPDCSLRDAIQTINLGSNHGGCTRVNNLTAYDKVLLPSGTYMLTINGTNEDFDVTGDLDIRKSMTISETGVTSPTVTGNPDWDDRIFDVVTGTVTIKGLIISGGAISTTMHDIGGGGVLIEPGTSLIMNNSRVTSNFVNGYVTHGGGIYNHGTATLNNVMIDGNTAETGGGIENWDTGTATLSNVTLDGNTAAYGGGIENLGTVNATNVTLDGNSTDPLYGEGGGGIKNFGILILTNSTVSGNTAGMGGGIYNIFGTGTLVNVTLAGNSAITGGGLYHNANTGSDHLTVENTIGSSAQGANCYVDPGSATQITSSGYNLSSDATCAPYLNQSGDLNNTDPKLGPLANNGGPTPTHALLPGSPAINRIPLITNGCGTTITTDQRGFPRPWPTGGRCDIGAFEFQANNNVLLFLPFIKK